MKSSVKTALNFSLIFGTLAVVLVVGLSGQEFSSAVAALTAVAPRWLFLCLAAYVVYVGWEAIALAFFLRRQGYKVGLRYLMFVSLMGMYYSNITPGATGGQPMQAFYLHKHHVPLGVATSALTVRYFCFQFMLAIISTVAWLVHHDFIAQQVGGNMWILVVGYVYNLFSVSLVLLMALCRPAVGFLIRLCIKLGTMLHICKHPEASAAKWQGIQASFHDSVKAALTKPFDCCIQLLIGGLSLLTQMLAIVFLFNAFKLTGANTFQLMTLGIMQYISAAYTPLPGASGAQEGVFALYFGLLFPDGIRFIALLLWRFFTFYITLILGALLSLFRGLKPHRIPPASKVCPQPSK